MSEFLSSYDFKKFKDHFKISYEHSLNYVRKQITNEEELFITIHITNECLKSWYDFKFKSVDANPTFIDILNVFLGENYAILIKNGCTRIEDHIRRLTSMVKSSFRGLRGHAYITYGKQIKKISIRRTETQSIGEVEQELHVQVEKNRTLEKENERLREQCEETYQNLLEALFEKRIMQKTKPIACKLRWRSL
jgi:uncharacterized protein (UPF0335 family)